MSESCVYVSVEKCVGVANTVMRALCAQHYKCLEKMQKRIVEVQLIYLKKMYHQSIHNKCIANTIQ